MKVADLSNEITRCEVQTDIAKIGFYLKMGLGANYTQLLAKTKWDALLAKVDIQISSQSGNRQIAYKADLKALAEIAAFDTSNIIIKESGTPMFADVFGTIEVSTGGALNLQQNTLFIDVVGLVLGDILTIYAIDMPITSEEYVSYEAKKVQMNVPTTVNLQDASLIAFTDKITKIDMLMYSGVRTVFEKDEILILNAESNEAVLNVSGQVFPFNAYMNIPVESVREATFYGLTDCNVMILRSKKMEA